MRARGGGVGEGGRMGEVTVAETARAARSAGQGGWARWKSGRIYRVAGDGTGRVKGASEAVRAST